MPEPDEPIYDAAAMAQLTADTDAEFRAIAIARFRLDLADFIARLEPAGPQERLRLIHTMSSSAALMGAMRLAARCLSLEAGALRIDGAEIRRILALASETAGFYADLEREKSGFRQGTNNFDGNAIRN